MRRQILPLLGALFTLGLMAVVAACSSETIIVQCSTGQSSTCVDNNGCSGTMTCGADGTYGPCQCVAPVDASVLDVSQRDASDPPDAADSAPILAGIGDPCQVNVECGSGMCATPGGVTGWCTKPCGTDGDCAGSHNGKNYKGQTNVCFVDKSNNYFCYAGCSKKADCADFIAYNSTTCGITNNSTLPYCAP